MTLSAYTKNLNKTAPVDPLYFCTMNGSPSWPNSYKDSFPLPGSLSGYKNSNWRDAIRNKRDATTPLSIVSDSIAWFPPQGRYNYLMKSPNPGSVPDRLVKGMNLYSARSIDPDQEFPALTAFANEMNVARNIALTYYNRYVSSMTTPFQSQVFLGELKETLEFIRHPFQKLKFLASSAQMAAYNKAVKKYRQLAIKHRSGFDRRNSQAKLLLDDVADAWFEVRFGLLPLVADIQAAMSIALSGQSTQRRSSFAGNAKATPSSTNYGPGYSVPGTSCNLIIDQSFEVDCFIHAGVLFNDTTDYSGMGEYLDKGLTRISDFVPTIYELIPGSWFVDTFSNLGLVLESFANSSKVTLLYGAQTYRARCDRRYTLVPIKGASQFLPASYYIVYSVPSQPGQVLRSRKWVQRSTLQSTQLSVGFKMPSGATTIANDAFYLARKFSNLFR